MESSAERESRWAEELREHRRCIRDEVHRAYKSRTAVEKRSLYDQWCKRYSVEFVKTLVNVAKDREICLRIMAWDVDNFGCAAGQAVYSVSRGKK